MLSILFGYSEEYEFHGPLELILGCIDFYELESTMVYVCKDFYLASKYSYLKRKIEITKLKRIVMALKRKKLRGLFDDYLMKLYQYECIGFDNEMFCFCAKEGLIKIMKVLIKDEKIDPAYKNNYAIRWASYNGHLEGVKLLIYDKRVDPSVKDNFAIKYASYNAFHDIVKVLLSHKRVNPCAQDNWAIKTACGHGYTKVVQVLLSDSCVNPCDGDNQTIVGACIHGYTDIVRMLLDDTRVRSCNLTEAFDKACENRHFHIVELLLSLRKNTIPIDIHINRYGNDFRLERLIFKLINAKCLGNVKFCKGFFQESFKEQNLKILKLLLFDESIIVDEFIMLLRQLVSDNYKIMKQHLKN